ncbi:MAG: hypothetical protein ACW986_00535 [Promethearchaeota archaeon]|jgi:hypothetical protein
MTLTDFEEIVRSITKLILSNPQKMIREEDLKNLSGSVDFEQIIGEVYANLKNFGFELITTKFLDQQFYILTSEGKDDDITPSQYGTLALIVAMSKEIDENIKIEDLKEIFVNVWDTDIQFLIENDYLRKFEELGVVKVAPLGKAIMKNIIVDLKLNNLLNLFKE